MITRELERKDLWRACVQHVDLDRVEGNTVFLRTTAKAAAHNVASSGTTEMLNRRSQVGQGDDVAGTLRIDVLTDSIVRFRYAEGESVPENPTPMVAGAFAGPTRCSVTEVNADKSRPAQIVITTAALQISIDREPYRVEITDLAGKRVCNIGGPEKDHFCNWDSYNTGLSRTTASETPLATENFDLDPDECIYGLGEQFIKLNKTGQTIDLDMKDGLGVITPRAYKNVPFYVSNKGYGVFFNHSCLMTAWVGSMTATDVQMALHDDFLDYFVIAGTIKQVLRQYTEITGKPTLPPAWTFGYWQSKFTYKSAEETLEIARQLRAHEIPCDVIHLDTFWFREDWFCDLEFDKERFPDPAGYMKELAEMGFNVSLWQLPYIRIGCKLFDDLKAVDGFAKTADGGIYDLRTAITNPHGCTGVIDYTNPAAVKVHQDYFRRLFAQGVKVIKTDFGEEAPYDAVWHDGTPSHRMHNLYPLLYNKAIAEVTEECTGDSIVWARSTWAGGQRYPIHWGGDVSPVWESLVPQITGGMSLGMSGFPFWSHDICGFMGATTDRKLMIRWNQLGMFMSHSRNHGAGDRELYKYPGDVLEIGREYIQLRYRLMPYILGQAARAVATSLPMMRPLVVDYQNDPNVWNLNDQYLFGDDLLVAPITTPIDRRRVYLPAGTWTDWWTGERMAGPRWIDVDADLRTIPLYIREGGIVPLGPVMNYVNEKPTDELTVRLGAFASDGRSEFAAMIDGKEVPMAYECKGGKHTLAVGACEAVLRAEAAGVADVTIETNG